MQMGNDTLAKLLGMIADAVLVVHEPMEELSIPELYKRCLNVIRIDKQTLLRYRLTNIINQRLRAFSDDCIVMACGIPESDVVVTIQENIWLIILKEVHPHLHIQPKIGVLIVGAFGSCTE